MLTQNHRLIGAEKTSEVIPPHLPPKCKIPPPKPRSPGSFLCGVQSLAFAGRLRLRGWFSFFTLSSPEQEERPQRVLSECDGSCPPGCPESPSSEALLAVSWRLRPSGLLTLSHARLQTVASSPNPSVLPLGSCGIRLLPFAQESSSCLHHLHPQPSCFLNLFTVVSSLNRLQSV